MATTKAKRKTSKPKSLTIWTRDVKNAKKAVSTAEKKIKAARRLVKQYMAAKKAGPCRPPLKSENASVNAGPGLLAHPGRRS